MYKSMQWLQIEKEREREPIWRGVSVLISFSPLLLIWTYLWHCLVSYHSRQSCLLWDFE